VKGSTQMPSSRISITGGRRLPSRLPAGRSIDRSLLPPPRERARRSAQETGVVKLK
jgi:hypothetical protein